MISGAFIRASTAAVLTSASSTVGATRKQQTTKKIYLWPPDMQERTKTSRMMMFAVHCAPGWAAALVGWMAQKVIYWNY